MMIYVHAQLIANPAVDAEPLTKARIGYQSYHATGTPVASTEETLQPVSALTNDLSFDIWTPTALPAWVYFDAGTAVDVDYIGLAAHTFATNGNTIKIQYSTDATNWIDLSGDVMPSNDGPLMFVFPEVTARFFRVYISGGTIPNLGAFFFGLALQMQRGMYGGHSPLELSRQTEYFARRSTSGQFVSRSIRRKGFSGSMMWDNLTAAWYRQYFDPFVETARTQAFFVAWNPLEFPDEVIYGWTTSDISPQNMGTRDLMSVSMSMEGLSIE